MFTLIATNHTSFLLGNFLFGEWSLSSTALHPSQARVFLASSWGSFLAGLVPRTVPLALHQLPAPLCLRPGTPEVPFLPLVASHRAQGVLGSAALLQKPPVVPHCSFRSAPPPTTTS